MKLAVSIKVVKSNLFDYKNDLILVRDYITILWDNRIQVAFNNLCYFY